MFVFAVILWEEENRLSGKHGPAEYYTLNWFLCTNTQTLTLTHTHTQICV